MLPTLDSKGDVLLVEKVSKHLNVKPKVGDLYIFISPDNPNRLICKRLVAKVA